MLTTITFGILASIASEVVVWLNKKLTNTVLHGRAAFLLAFTVALIGAGIKIGLSGVSITNWATLSAVFAQIWTVAQLFFVIVVETLKLDVKEE